VTQTIITTLGGGEPLDKALHGERATTHARLAHLDVPLRRALCLSGEDAEAIAAGGSVEAIEAWLEALPADATSLGRAYW